MRRATAGKLLGLAGLAGVAATGAVLARDERQRRAYSPDDVRARLHARAEAAATAEQFFREQGEPTPDLVELPTQRGQGAWIVPAAATRRGRLAQRFRRQQQRLARPVTTAVSNQVGRLRAVVRRRRP